MALPIATMKKKYGIEIAGENLLREITHLVRDFRYFFFRIPKNKMDKTIFVIDSCAWILLFISLVLRIGRW